MAATARANDGQPAALSWVRAETASDCASARELADQVEEQLGRPVFVAPAQAGIAIEASIARQDEPAGYRVRFGLIESGQATTAQRVLVLPPVACRELDPLLVFVLAAMLDPDAPLLPPRLPAGLSDATRSLLADLFGNEPTVPPLSLAEPSAKPAPPRAADAPADQPPPVAAKPHPERRHNYVAQPRLAVFASAGAAVGVLPSIDPPVALELRWRFAEAWLLRGSAAFWFTRAVLASPSASATFSAWTGSVLACPAPLLDGAWPLRACAGAILGRLSTSVDGVATPRDPSTFYAAAALALDLSWSPRPGFWLRAGASGLLSVIRARFLFEDGGENRTVHRPSLFGAQLDLGVGVTLF